MLKEGLTLFILIASSSALANEEGHKVIQQEKVYHSKGGDQTVIDFDEVSISGVRHTPIGSLIQDTKADKSFNFVKARPHFKSEMLKSTENLSSPH